MGSRGAGDYDQVRATNIVSESAFDAKLAAARLDDLQRGPMVTSVLGAACLAQALCERSTHLRMKRAAGLSADGGPRSTLRAKTYSAFAEGLKEKWVIPTNAFSTTPDFGPLRDRRRARPKG
jgi:hypothetical protein